MESKLNIEKKRNGEKLTIELSGRLDTVTSPKLSEIVDEELEGINNLEMDLKDLEYLSSAGLRVLLAAYKKMQAVNGVMTVSNAGEAVREVFKITGFDRTLGIK